MRRTSDTSGYDTECVGLVIRRTYVTLDLRAVTTNFGTDLSTDLGPDFGADFGTGTEVVDDFSIDFGSCFLGWHTSSV